MHESVCIYICMHVYVHILLSLKLAGFLLYIFRFQDIEITVVFHDESDLCLPHFSLKCLLWVLMIIWFILPHFGFSMIHLVCFALVWFFADLTRGQLSWCNWAAVLSLVSSSSSPSSSSVYSTPGPIFDASEFMCGIYICILPPLMHIE